MHRRFIWLLLGSAGCTVSLVQGDDPASSSTGVGTSTSSTATGPSPQGSGTTTGGDGGGGAGDGGAASNGTGGDATSAGGDATSAGGAGGDETSAGGAGPCGGRGEACCPGDLCDDATTPCDTETNRCLGCGRVLANGNSASVTCLERKDGQQVCWGAGFDYLVDCQSATLGPVESTIFDDVRPLAFAGHGCGVGPDDTLACWGANEHGETAAAPPTTPSCTITPTDSMGVIDVQVTDGTSIALVGDQVYGWGSNEYGQLGIDDDADLDDHPVPAPLAAFGADAYTAIAAAYEATCALKEDKTVYCVGDNSEKVLGSSNVDLAPGTGHAPDIDDVDELVAGGNFVCARTGGDVHCWGSNYANVLGSESDAVSESEPQLVIFPEDLGAKHVYAGGGFACAILTDDSVACWGRNTNRQTGNCGLDRPLPARVYLDEEENEPLYAKQLALGSATGCAIDPYDQTYCWGRNFYYEAAVASEKETIICPPRLVPIDCE